MSKKKACKRRKVFVEEDLCPTCKTSSFTTSWQGRLYVSNKEKSMIAEKVNVPVKGEYAIKVR